MISECIQINEINSVTDDLCDSSSLIAYKIREYIYDNSIAIIKKIIITNSKNKDDPIPNTYTRKAFIYLEWNNNELAIKIQDDLINNEKSILQISDTIVWEMTMQNNSINVLHNSICSVTTYYMNQDEYKKIISNNDQAVLTDSNNNTEDHTMYRDNYVEFVITE
jgi:hypothetical protein